jgi:hypothetical protein
MTLLTWSALEKFIIRKDHVMCTQCCRTEPVHVGDGTPASTFIMALEMMAERHLDCAALAAPRQGLNDGRR